MEAENETLSLTDHGLSRREAGGTDVTETGWTGSRISGDDVTESIVSIDKLSTHRCLITTGGRSHALSAEGISGTFCVHGIMIGRMVQPGERLSAPCQRPQRSRALQAGEDSTGSLRPQGGLSSDQRGPWPWTCSLQNCEPHVSVVYKPPILYLLLWRLFFNSGLRS